MGVTASQVRAEFKRISDLCLRQKRILKWLKNAKGVVSGTDEVGPAGQQRVFSSLSGDEEFRPGE